jgi:hypothetical protein
MMKRYLIILPLIIFLSIGCGDNLSTSTKDESASVTANFLAGTWTAECVDNTTASTSTKTVLVFSAAADNLSSTSTNYSDLNCVTQNYVITKTLSTLSLGTKSTTVQYQIMTKYTAVVSSITLEPKTSNAATSLNSTPYCGITGWSSGAQTSIAGLTCGSISYKAQNAVYSDLIQVNSEKTFIRLGNTTNLGSNGYPKTLYTEEYYK